MTDDELQALRARDAREDMRNAEITRLRADLARVELEMESALVGLFWMQVGAVAALALWLDYIDFHCATTWDAPTTLPEEVNGWTDDLRRILAHGSPVWRLEATSDA